MNHRMKHIAWWLGGILLLLCQSCGSSGDSEPEEEVTKPQLEIHVFTPERPVVTRGDIGETEAEEAERTIHTLKIWVFEHDSGDLVGYLNPADVPTNESKTYRMTVTDQFALAPPNVDVYVMANVTTDNTGISLDKASSRADIEAALMGSSRYGLSSLQTTVPGDGLPMSGVLKNQAVSGLAPVLSVSTNVLVVRAVSKIRFVFSRAQSEETLKVTRITLDEEMLPDEEYLFLSSKYTGRNYRVGTEYNTTSQVLFGNLANTSIPTCAEPGNYTYVGQTGQEYENLIDAGLSQQEPELAELGMCYLRESDKQMGGKIYYKVGSADEVDNAEEKSAAFTMSEAGDFSRNHTWIVYGFFAGKDNLRIFSVTVREWNETEGAHEVYNW